MRLVSMTGGVVQVVPEFVDEFLLILGDVRLPYAKRTVLGNESVGGRCRQADALAHLFQLVLPRGKFFIRAKMLWVFTYHEDQYSKY